MIAQISWAGKARSNFKKITEKPIQGFSVIFSLQTPKYLRTCYELIYTSCLSGFPISSSESLAVLRRYIFFLHPDLVEAQASPSIKKSPDTYAQALYIHCGVQLPAA